MRKSINIKTLSYKINKKDKGKYGYESIRNRF